MHIVLTGGTGLIGKALGQTLANKNYKIHLLTRKQPDDIPYPCQVFLWPDVHSPLPLGVFPKDEDYAVIHLAGEPVSQWPWTSHLKNKIYNSRIKGTQNLVDTIQQLPQPPSFFISVTAIGIYGEQGSRQMTEGAEILDQNLFLQKVCKEWEKEALKVQNVCRTIILRLGMVLSYEKGFLYEQAKWIKKRVRPLILAQNPCWLSWIALEDLIRMIVWNIENDQNSGIYNAVSPKAVVLNDFYTTLAEQMNIKTLPLPSPLFLMRLIGGEMTKNLLTSCKVFPEKAIKQGFVFKKEELNSALKI